MMLAKGVTPDSGCLEWMLKGLLIIITAVREMVQKEL